MNTKMKQRLSDDSPRVEMPDAPIAPHQHSSSLMEGFQSSTAPGDTQYQASWTQLPELNREDAQSAALFLL